MKKRIKIELEEIVAIKDIISEAKNECYPLKVYLDSGEEQILFVHYFIYLKSELTIIGEKVQDGALMFISSKEIKSVLFSRSKDLRPQNKISAVDRYVTEIRKENGLDDRLILKLSHHVTNCGPPNHFLIKPFMTTNQYGNMIWAATIEISEVLFDWLISLNGEVEVMGTDLIKREYLSYCEDKLIEEQAKIPKVV